MKSKTLLAALGILMIAFSACQPHAEYCTVRGTVQGVSDGAELELQDAWNQFKVIASTTVENGSFEFHPRISVPTHVYLYAKNPKDVYANPWDGGQLKDFILEPGTVSVQVNAEDVSDMSTGAAGTPLNETYRKILAADEDEKEALWEEAINDEKTNLLALRYADSNSRDPSLALEILDRLSPEQAKAHKRFVSILKKRIARNMKAEERKSQLEQSPEDTLPALQYYIDMELPGPDGHLVSLKSVLENPANRYVLLDFWATWCAPCLKSIPELKEAYARYHDKGLEIVSVSQDSKTQEWKSFVAENGMPWVNVLDKNRKAGRDYRVEYIPTVFLIDCKTGEILLRAGQPDFEAILSDLLP